MQLAEYQNMFDLETSHWWYNTLHKLVESVVAKESKGNHFKILDAGCGTGSMMEILSKYGEVAGIDYSSQAVSFAKSRGLKNVFQQDLNIWEPEPDFYDIILSLDVLYAVENDIDILKKIFKALKPGGTLILNLPAFEILRREHDLVVNTKRRYHKKQFMNELTALGFIIKIASYRQVHLFGFIYLKKLFLKLVKLNSEPKSDLKKSASWSNAILEKYGSMENRLILSGINLPVGSSLFVVAKK